MLQRYIFSTIIVLLINFLLITLNAFGRLPFGLYDFIFIFTLTLAVALYQPRLIFWLFISSIPLENIILSPEQLPISLRPFQFFGFILFLATILLWLTKKLDFLLLSKNKICFICKLFKLPCKITPGQKYLNSFDRLVFLLPVFSLLGVLNSPTRAVSVKLSLVLISFVVLYWLLRNYLQTNQQKFEVIWFTLLGAKIVLIFGFYQALANKFGWLSFEVMPGRINSTFTEPDWLGMYLVLIIALVLWLKFYYLRTTQKVMLATWSLNKVTSCLANIFLLALVFELMLTVARSAWLGLVGVVLVYLFLIIIDKQIKIKKLFFEAGYILIILAFSVLVIEYFQLSSFHLANRAASSVSGKQKITISCQQNSSVPMEVNSVDELSNYNCRHINLEEIENEKSVGNEVKEVYRPDPNVNIRKNIYLTIFTQILKYPILGQGQGSSAVILGADERGSGLNASNIFLETWLSMGIGGLGILFLLIVWLPLLALLKIFKNLNLNSFILLSSAAIVIPNLFNAGLLIGFFWLWLAVMTDLSSDQA